MTTVESPSSTGELNAIETALAYRRCRIHDSEPSTQIVGTPPRLPHIAHGGSAATEAVATDQELTARFQREAIPLLKPLYRRALRLTHSQADAEDLLQDTMLRAYSKFRSFRDGSNVNAWLHVILKNTYISGYRKRQRRPELCPTDQITDQQLAANAEHSSTGLRTAEDEALARLPDTRIREAMQALPDQMRMTVYYADVAGFRNMEIAQIMSTPLGTVMSRLHRGRRRLQNILADVTDDTEPPSWSRTQLRP